MAYSKRNLLNKIIEVQTIVLRESKRGIPQKHIYEALIKNSYHISYSTFNNYLARNAKKELELLDNKKEDKQTKLF
jgi:hypothetical protein